MRSYTLHVLIVSVVRVAYNYCLMSLCFILAGFDSKLLKVHRLHQEQTFAQLPAGVQQTVTTIKAGAATEAGQWRGGRGRVPLQRPPLVRARSARPSVLI